MATSLPEVWLRGPVPGVSPLLQPVAHTLLQAAEEIERAAMSLDVATVNARPGGAASIGFHLRHIRGVLDRLLTYARGEQLTREQLAALRAEEEPATESGVVLAAATIRAIHEAVERLKAIDESSLFEPRGVGRARLPSTVLGLLFHAAEHTSRHTGQLLATAKILGAPAA